MAVLVKSKVFKVTALAAILMSSLQFVQPAQAAIPFTSLKGEVPSLAPMVEKVTPAVVNISVAGSKEVKAGMDPFQYFFGNRRGPQTQERPFKGLGSGVIIDKDKGYVVTNNHVIDDADEILVTLKDGRQFEAKKIGSDAQSDVALLKIDPDNLSEIKIADSDRLRVGDFVVAIGNPFGLGQTVTSGIVSAKGRHGLSAPSQQGLEDFIQTDAAINSGNSGGALVNLKGELVGINTAIIAPGGGNVGIGFAIPSIMMNNLVNQLIEFGEVKRGVLGITGYDFNADLAKTFELDIAQGAFVQQVIPDSSADKGGLKYGDVVTHVDGIKISSFNELRSKVSTKGAGSEIELTVNRSGDVKKVVVVLGAADKPAITAGNIHPALKGATFSSGKAENGVTGVQVTELEERSPASMLGLEQNDIIIGVNRTRIQSVSDLRDALEEAKGVMALNVVRGNSSLYILIR